MSTNSSGTTQTPSLGGQFSGGILNSGVDLVPNAGAQGPQGSYIVVIYLKAETAPATPTDVTWTPGGSVGTLSGTNSAGWSLTIPSGSDSLWESVATFNPAISTNITTWSVAVRSALEEIVLFDLHDDVDREGTAALEDRIVFSDESATGDPNTYTTVQDFIANPIVNELDARYEPKIPHATEPLATFPSGLYQTGSSPTTQESGNIDADAINNSNGNWGFFDNRAGYFPNSGENYSTGQPSTWSGFFNGSYAYMAFSDGNVKSLAFIDILSVGHVGKENIYLLAYRDASNWAIWHINGGVGSQGRQIYIIHQPTLVNSMGTPAASIRWMFNLNASTNSISNITVLRNQGERVFLSNDRFGLVPTAAITDSAVTTAKVADNAITNAKMADNSVNTSEIADNAVTNAKLADNAVNTAEITDSAVTTAKIADGAITTAKLNPDAIDHNALSAAVKAELDDLSTRITQEHVYARDHLNGVPLPGASAGPRDFTSITIAYGENTSVFNFTVVEGDDSDWTTLVGRIQTAITASIDNTFIFSTHVFDTSLSPAAFRSVDIFAERVTGVAYSESTNVLSLTFDTNDVDSRVSSGPIGTDSPAATLPAGTYASGGYFSNLRVYAGDNQVVNYGDIESFGDDNHLYVEVSNGVVPQYSASDDAWEYNEIPVASVDGRSTQGSFPVASYPNGADNADRIGLAVGIDSSATGGSSVAIGTDADAISDGSVALGSNVTSGHTNNSITQTVAVGCGATASGNRSISLGHSTTASGGTSLAVGYNSTASSSFGVAIGQNSEASGAGGIAIGSSSDARATGSIGIGDSATVTNTSHTNSIVIGNTVSSTAAHQLTLGGPTITSIRSSNTNYNPTETQDLANLGLFEDAFRVQSENEYLVFGRQTAPESTAIASRYEVIFAQITSTITNPTFSFANTGGQSDISISLTGTYTSSDVATLVSDLVTEINDNQSAYSAEISRDSNLVFYVTLATAGEAPEPLVTAAPSALARSQRVLVYGRPAGASTVEDWVNVPYFPDANSIVRAVNDGSTTSILVSGSDTTGVVVQVNQLGGYSGVWTKVFNYDSSGEIASQTFHAGDISTTVNARTDLTQVITGARATRTFNRTNGALTGFTVS